MKDILIPLFESFTTLVLSAGGDGGGTIICRSRSVKEMSDWYEEWNSKRPYAFKREDRPDGSVTFSDMQECILFEAGEKVTQECCSPGNSTIETWLTGLKGNYVFGDYILII